VRFQTKRGNRGLILGTSIFLLASSGFRLLFLDSIHPAWRWLAVFQAVCSLLLVVANAPSYCEFQETSLVLRQGWRRKFSIPYASIEEIKLAGRRILIATKDERRVVVSVVDKARFLREAHRRCPGLNLATEEA
jgi:hypothetical protein